MKPNRGAVLGTVVVLAVGGCGGGSGPEPPTPVKDSEVRTWIRDELDPYLLLIAKELCAVKNAAAANVGVPDLCGTTGDPEGVTKPPPNGNP